MCEFQENSIYTWNSYSNFKTFNNYQAAKLVRNVVHHFVALWSNMWSLIICLDLLFLFRNPNTISDHKTFIISFCQVALIGLF